MKPRCARLGKLCPSPVPPWAQEEDLRESSVDQGRGAKARKTATRQGRVPTASRGVRWGAARLHGEGGGRVQAPVLWDSAAMQWRGLGTARAPRAPRSCSQTARGGLSPGGGSPPRTGGGGGLVSALRGKLGSTPEGGSLRCVRPRPRALAASAGEQTLAAIPATHGRAFPEARAPPHTPTPTSHTHTCLLLTGRC